MRQKKLVEYRQLEAFLDQMLREAEKDLSKFNVARSGEFVLTGILFVCDSLVDIVKDRAGLAGYVVDKAYSGGKLMVDATYSNLDASKGYALLVKNKADLTDMMLEEGNITSRNLLGHTAAVIERFAELYKWWHENGKKGFGENSGIKAGISTLNRQLSKIRFLIKEIELQQDSSKRP